MGVGYALDELGPGRWVSVLQTGFNCVGGVLLNDEGIDGLKYLIINYPTSFTVPVHQDFLNREISILVLSQSDDVFADLL